MTTYAWRSGQRVRISLSTSLVSLMRLRAKPTSHQRILGGARLTCAAVPIAHTRRWPALPPPPTNSTFVQSHLDAPERDSNMFQRDRPADVDCRGLFR